jgi:hypothetical protein
VTLNLPNLEVADYSHINFPKGEDTGEMGGKRRKLPHERAGWKEMDQEPRTKRKRGGRRAEENANGEGNMGDMGYLTAQVNPKDDQVHMSIGGGNDPSFAGATGEGEGSNVQMPSGGNQDGSETVDAAASP